jgi:DNA-binding LytR/AlgR family response regulator
VLLDIQMPGADGLHVAKAMAELPTPPRVIFVTAYDAYAVDAFELEAVDYLLKPVDAARLRLSLQRIERRDDGSGEALRRLLQRLAPVPPAAPARLALLDEASGVRQLVNLSDIAWFTSVEERTYVQVGARTLRSMETLAALEEKLPRDRFIRTHRAYIVNIEQVREVVPWASGTFNLRLHGIAQRIPLSRGYAADFKRRTGWL